MTRQTWLLAILGALVIIPATHSLAVDPNPLQNAYWRFEEGTDGARVDSTMDNVVKDGANENHMRTFMDPNVDARPQYTSTVAPFDLRSGLPNTLALDFAANPNPPGGGDDLFTVQKQIDNGMIAAGGGFTLEAAFRPDVVGGPFQAIVAKNGVPTGSLPTLVMKVRGDNGNLQLEQYDEAGALVGVQSSAPLEVGQWYAAAAVNDGSTLSLYLRGESDLDYVLQGSTPVSGALYQGTDPIVGWDRPWSIGRTVFGGAIGQDGDPADWFDGIIDEVRLTNVALAPSEFLFRPVPEPASIALVVLGAMGWICRRPSRATCR